MNYLWDEVNNSSRWWWWRIKVFCLLSSSQSAGVNKSTNICKQWCTCFLLNKHSCLKRGPRRSKQVREGRGSRDWAALLVDFQRQTCCVRLCKGEANREETKIVRAESREETNHPVIIPLVCELPNSPSLIDSPDPITQHTATMDWRRDKDNTIDQPGISNETKT